jgi:hypothetical protein
MESPEQREHLRTLARRVNDGNCVLLLGPGASTDCCDAQETPIHQRLARELAGRLTREQKKDLNPDDLRHVSQVLLGRTKNLTGLQDQVIDFYQQFAGRTTDFHRSLAALPFRFCVTTTPDDFLFNALREAGKRPVRDFYNFRRPRTLRPPEPTVQEPLVYHLYGYPSEPASLVITENDLIDFLTHVICKAPPLSETLTAELCRLDSTFLFMDLGFKNWYLRVLMRSLDLHSHHEMSVALESPDFFAQSKQHQTTVYFPALTIAFHQDSLKDFATKLRATYETIVAASHQAEPEPAPEAPEVFLSYASEDRELVENLGRKLRAAGIAVWQDKQNLRTGDDWKRALKYVIGKQVDYVVVVQTATMKSRLEGYYNHEIREAMFRHEGMTPYRFLLPVCTSQLDVLPALEDLHATPINSENGVNALIQSVFEDWKLRPRRSRFPTLATASGF